MCWSKSRSQGLTAFAQVLPGFAPIIVPVWLVTHREVHTSRRVRLVFDLMASELARAYRP